MSEHNPIRVVIVEDHAMVAEAFAMAIDAACGVAVAGVAGTLRDALALIEREQPAVVVMDHRLPDGDGAQAAPAVKARAPEAAVLIVTAEPAEQVAAAAVEGGCSGVVAKDQAVKVLVESIRAVDGGDTGGSPRAR